MESQRSSIVRQNEMSKSTRSSLIRQGGLLSPRSTLLVHDEKDVSTKDFIQSCSYRIEDIDRNAIIRRQDMESCLKRLSNRDDVYGVIVATIDGQILYECDALKNWIPTLASLCAFARHLVRNNDPNDFIQALRLRTKLYEIIVTIRQEQLLIVMQMLSTSNDMNVGSKIMEEDWHAFLKKLQEEKLKNEP